MAAEKVVVLDKSFVTDPGLSPVCCLCKNMGPDQFKVCRAFPNGIPLEIWSGSNTHTSSFPGDHGIQFEEIEDGD